MWKFIAGFGIGVYIGTYYECKPVIIRIKKFVKDNFPGPRDNSDSSSSNENSLF